MNIIEKKMTTREVVEVCGVTEKTVRENAKTFGKTFKNGKLVDKFMYNEEAKEVLANLVAEY